MKKIFKAIVCLAVGAMCVFGQNAEVKAMKKDREVLNFNTGWLYSPTDYTNAFLQNFDDSGFENVCIPHANTVLTKHKGGEESFLKQIASYRFVSWYRRHFTLGEEYKGKVVRVEFEGVANVCDVYVNGEKVKEHKGAYTSFSCDVTDYIKLGEDNVIAVRCDSTKRSDVPPEGGNVDYCLFGGIVRNVNMIVTDEVYVKDVFVTSEVSKERAVVKAEVTLSQDAEFRLTLTDADGKDVAHGTDEVTIENPHLWSIDDPYLYTARVEAIKDGEVRDTYLVKIGLRWFEFVNDGLKLNGEVVKIMGINRHEQWPWQGRAVPDKLQKRDADMIKETGFNAVRCSHYPQSPAFLDRCDEIGLIVFEEAPGWQHIGNEQWQELYKENIREMIVRDRNHPSIFSWGVRVNESNDSDKFYKETNELARSLDATRPTHGARRQDTYQSSTYYEDIYTAHYTYPQNPVHTPFLVTEHSWDCWTNGYGYSWATDEEALAFTKDFADKVNYYYGNENCAGGFAWSMFDYNNEVNYTRTNHVFYSGMYDIFRLPKMAANLYISQKDPAKYGGNIYIANYWDDDSKPLTVKEVSGDIAQGNNLGGGVVTGDKFSVTVMSNCETVELYVNGEKVDKEPARLYTNLPHPFFVFEDIKYEEGAVTAIGYIDGKEAARYTQRTPEKAHKLILTPDYDTIVADGTDMTQVTVTLTDKNGTRIPSGNIAVKLTLRGAGEFIGEENIELEGGRCAFIVKSKYLQTGEICCEATADGIESGKCTIEAVNYQEENNVPFSFEKGDVRAIEVKEYNDTNKVFEYSNGWQYVAQSDCYQGDNHYSDIEGESVVVKFVGSMIEWYGSTNSNHGIASFAIDGGEEIFIDCYSETRKDNYLLYSVDNLEYGEHTLCVRVTGKKNVKAKGCYINADRVKVTDNSNFHLAGNEELIYENDWVKHGGTWMLTNGTYTQKDSSGDRFAVCEKKKFEDGRIECEISIPTKEGAGVGIIGRYINDKNFYLAELKKTDSNLTWAIWLNENNAWTSLVSGTFDNILLGESVRMRFDMNKTKMTLSIQDANGAWRILGSCNDLSLNEGYVGIRTHSSTASFGKVVFAEKINCRYEIKEVKTEGNVIKSIVIENTTGETKEGDCVTVACYRDDVLLKCEQIKADEADEVEIEIEGNRVKIFVWENMNAVSRAYEMKNESE